MSTKVMETVEILKQEHLTSDVSSMWVQTDKIAGLSAAGQFVSIYCNDSARLLPRPISICETDIAKGRLRFVYRAVGAGTAEFAAMLPGTHLKMLGPLGNGFMLQKASALLVGGGIGIPPLVELGRVMKANSIPLATVCGYRDSELFLSDELKDNGSLYIATEDGSVGTAGNVIDAIKEKSLSAEVIYACGPRPMLKALKAYALEKSIPCYISMEERMACGIGACLGCVCESHDIDEHSHVTNKRVCTEGPVFLSTEVEL